MAYKSIASSQIVIGKYDLAVTNLLKTIEFFRKTNNLDGLVSTCTNLGNAYLGLKNYDKTYYYYDYANVLAKKNGSIRKDLIGLTNLNLGNLFLE